MTVDLLRHIHLSVYRLGEYAWSICLEEYKCVGEIHIILNRLLDLP